MRYEKIPYNDTDVRYPSFQQGFNRRWFARNLKAVYLCFDPEGTAAALDDAIAAYGGGVKILGGGHCYENFVFSDETRAILNVDPMNEVGLDPDRGYYLEAGGSNWGSFKKVFRDYGAVLPGGSCYSVGLGGHISGGGYGLLSRRDGLTVDTLTGVEIVVKDGSGPAQVKYVSINSTGADNDLFWACRGGGGGNFGVITKYYYATLPTAPALARIYTLAWDWQDLTQERLSGLLEVYADFAEKAPGPWFGLFHLFHKAKGQISLTLQHAADTEEELEDGHNAVYLPFKAALDAVYPIIQLKSFHPLPGGWGPVQGDPDQGRTYFFYEAVQTVNGSGPNQRGKYKSAYMKKGFPDTQVQAIYEGLQYVPFGLTEDMLSQSLVQIDTYGGKINGIPSTETPIPQRSSILKLQYQTYWLDPAFDQAFLNWIDELYSHVYAPYGGAPNPARDPEGVVDGCYYNYPDSDLNEIMGGLEGALYLYFLENLPRLIATKKCWDPNNYFNSKQSIPV